MASKDEAENEGSPPPTQVGRVQNLSMQLEKDIVFPNYSHRDTNLDFTIETLVEEKQPAAVLTSKSLKSEFIDDDESMDEAFYLSPHRFGSIDDGQAFLRWRQDDEDGESCNSDELPLSISDAASSPNDTSSSEPIAEVHFTLTTSNTAEDILPVSSSDTFIVHEESYEDSVGSPTNFHDFVDAIWNAKKHPPPKLPPAPENLSKIQKKRRYIMEDILSTERSYIDVLQSLVEDFDAELQKTPILTKKQRKQLFYKVPHLLQIHRSFQISLESCVQNWDSEERVGDCFTACFSRETVREVYAAYINNYTDAMDSVKTLSESNKAFASFLMEKQRTGHTRLPLVGLMVKPIQRFPQFIMLLQDLLKNTAEDHADYYSLLQALTVIETLANYLNDKKRGSEQENEASKVMRQLKHRLPDLNEDEKLKILNRTNVEFNRYSKSGKLKAQHEQELILFNTMVMCCSKNAEGLLKEEWRAQLEAVKIENSNMSPDLAISVCKDNLGQTVITSNNNSAGFTAMDEGAKKRIEELQALIYDHTVISKIISLTSNLNYSYRGFDENALEFICSSLQRSIQQKADENRLIDSSLLTLKVSRKADRFPKPITYIFNFGSPRQRNMWVNEFVHARLSQDITNRPTWFMCDASTVDQLHRPLFIANTAVDISRNLGEVYCAVPVCLVYGSVLKRHVWCCHVNAGVTIISIYNHTPTILQNFTCEDLPPDTNFWCVEVVPGCIEATDIHNQADMVWIGTSTNLILLFSLLESERHRPFFQIETESPIVSLCYADGRVYAGLLNGFVFVYMRNSYGSWYPCESLQVGVSAVVRLAKIPNRSTVVAASNRNLVKITPEDVGFELEVINLDPPELESSGHVQDFVVSETTAWVAFQDSLTLQLIHLQTHKAIQCVYLQKILKTLKEEKSYQQDIDDSVTCLGMVKGLLLIGTREGFICKVNIPKVESSLMKSTSPCAVSLHKHLGAVRFITAFQNLMEKLIESINFEYNSDEGEIALCPHKSLDDRAPEESLGSERNPRRVSMTVLSNKWLSNPNLLLTLQEETESKAENNLGDLMVAFQSMELINEEENATSQPPADHSKSSSAERKAMEKQVILDGLLIVTGGLGYLDLEFDRGGFEDETEGCIMSWCE